MSAMVPDDAPKPRLCHVKRWEDFSGYGFNLHAEKGKVGQFIGKVDANSPADFAGLKEGDRIVEVNGTNISNENHGQVVQRIKAVSNEVRMLVVDKAADDYYKAKKIIITGEMPNVVVGVSPDCKPGSEAPAATPAVSPPEEQHASEHNPRLCILHSWPDFQGYGFNLHAEKGKQGQYIGKVDSKSPADGAGLRDGDKILEVNGHSIEGENHKQVVDRIKAKAGTVSLLVVDAAAEQHYASKGENIHGNLPNVVTIECGATSSDASKSSAVEVHSAPAPVAAEEINDVTSGIAAVAVTTEVVHTAVVDNELPADAPRLRLCKLKRWKDFTGYGFNLHAEKGKPGHFIGTVDDSSPAQHAGLLSGDRLVEVNDLNVWEDNHHQVVEKVKMHPDHVSMLVMDQAGEEYYRNVGIKVHGKMPNIDHIDCPDAVPVVAAVATVEDDKLPSDAPRIRLCHLKRWQDFSGYGFNLHVEKGKEGHFIGAIDKNSPAELAGLRQGDRIVEVNGANVLADTHGGVVQKVKSNPSAVTMLVVDATAEEYYKNQNINLHSGLGIVDAIVCPDLKPAEGQANGEAIVTQVTPPEETVEAQNGHVEAVTPEPPKPATPEPPVIEVNGVQEVAVAAPVTPEPEVFAAEDQTSIEKAPEPAKPAQPAADGTLPLSLAEMKAKLSQKKKYDPRRDTNMSMKAKYDLFQNL